MAVADFQKTALLFSYSPFVSLNQPAFVESWMQA
jgi:hypothetical protein